VPGCLERTEAVAAKQKNPDVLVDEESILDADARWTLAARVARSSSLHRATQLRDILLFIVRQTVLQPDEPISEFEIAHRVLGRRSDFNPLDDNIVRVQMAHLRKKLDLYFSTEGKDESVVVTIALGTYKPVFSRRASSSPPQTAEVPHDAPGKEPLLPVEEAAADPADFAAESKSTRSRKPPLLAIAAAALLLALAGGCAVLWMQVRSQRRQLEQIQHALSPWRDEPSLAGLWSGFLDSTRDTDVVISDDSFLLMEEIAKKQTPFYGYLGRSYLTPQESSGLSPQLRDIEDLLASKNLGNNSEYKLAQRIMTLDPLGRHVHFYSARQYMPALVRQDNVILIGGRVSNPWSELFEGRLNFVENTVFHGLGETTVTNRAPAAGEPKNFVAGDTVGYCVVAYLPNPGHEGKVLLIEGTSSEATEAAGDFLLSPEQFSAFRAMLHAERLPYFEVLLKTSQVRGAPLTATIEAYRAYPALN